MRAVSFNVTIPSFLIGKGLGKITESAIFGGLSGVTFGCGLGLERPGVTKVLSSGTPSS